MSLEDDGDSGGQWDQSMARANEVQIGPLAE